MELSRLKSLVADGRIFSVLFTKRTNGSDRRMVARTGVHRGLTGHGRTWDPEEKGLLQVYDMENQGYRMIPAESVREIRARKQVLKF